MGSEADFKPGCSPLMKTKQKSMGRLGAAPFYSKILIKSSSKPQTSCCLLKGQGIWQGLLLIPFPPAKQEKKDECELRRASACVRLVSISWEAQCYHIMGTLTCANPITTIMTWLARACFLHFSYPWILVLVLYLGFQCSLLSTGKTGANDWRWYRDWIWPLGQLVASVMWLLSFWHADLCALDGI